MVLRSIINVRFFRYAYVRVHDICRKCTYTFVQESEKDATGVFVYGWLCNAFCMYVRGFPFHTSQNIEIGSYAVDLWAITRTFNSLFPKHIVLESGGNFLKWWHRYIGEACHLSVASTALSLIMQGCTTFSLRTTTYYWIILDIVTAPFWYYFVYSTILQVTRPVRKSPIHPSPLQGLLLSYSIVQYSSSLLLHLYFPPNLFFSVLSSVSRTVVEQTLRESLFQAQKEKKRSPFHKES